MADRSQRLDASSRPAFTLIELLLLLAIIAVLAAMAAPRYNTSMALYRADAAAQRVKADLLLAASSARTSGASRTVSFDLAGGQYALPEMTSGDRDGSVYVVSLDREPYVASIASAEFGGFPSVTFNGFGMPNRGGQVVLQSGDFEKTVILDAATGEVTIE